MQPGGFMEYIPRQLEKTVQEMCRQFKVTLVTGPRQVGKTTMLCNCLKEKYEYVTLDDMNDLSLAKSDPALFFKNHTLPVLIDEVQYAPELFRYIKFLVDRKDNRGLICLTGSQTYLLMKNVSESLAGRIGIADMLGLSLREKNDVAFSRPFLPTTEYADERSKELKPYQNIWQAIFRGGMPELADPACNWEFFFRSYVKSYIERDVRSLLQIKDETLFYRFLVTLAARTGELFVPNDIANSLGISLKTVQSWTAILETSGLVYLLRPYENNITKRTIKTPKLYFTDTGLVCYLVGWDNPKVAENGAMSGSLFETFVVSEIIKSYLNAGEDTRNIFFYRDRDMKEIDLLILKNGVLYPVEIKKSARPALEMAKNFPVLKTGFDITVGQGCILCLAEKRTILSDTVSVLPVEYI